MVPVGIIRAVSAPLPVDKPPPSQGDAARRGEVKSDEAEAGQGSRPWSLSGSEEKWPMAQVVRGPPMMNAIARAAGIGLSGSLSAVRVNGEVSLPFRHMATVTTLSRSMAAGRRGLVDGRQSALPYVQAYLNGFYSDSMLLDSGSEVAAVSEEFFNQLQLHDSSLKLGPEKQKLKGAGLENLSVIGSCSLSLSADQEQKKSMGTIEFSVIKGLSQLALIGFPLIKQGTIHKFNAGRSKWTCTSPEDGKTINFPLWTPQESGEGTKLRSLMGIHVNDAIIAGQAAATLLDSVPEPFKHIGSEPEEDPMSKEISADEVSFNADKAKAKAVLEAMERPKQLSRTQWRQLMDEVLLPHLDLMVWRNRDPDKQAQVLGEHKIVLKPDATPFNKPPFAGSVDARRAMSEEVQKMKELGIVGDSSSPYASPAFVQKKPGRVPPEWRFLLDCREINDRTIKDVYPLPRIDQTIDALRNAKFITVMDLRAGYFQIPIRKQDRHLTAFKYDGGLAEFLFMAQGLCNAPSTFQRLMDHVLAGIKHDFCFAYLDDIIIFSRTFEEHVQHVSEVFKRLRKFNLTVSPSKCHFAQPEVRFLGHIVGDGKIKPDPEKIAALQHMLPPSNHSQCRSFIGLVNYYRAFVPHFADIARPLHKAASAHGAFEISSEALLAFHQLKWLLQNAPVLRCSEPKRRYFLSTDASKEALGAVLGQKDDDGNEYVIAYASKALQGAERNYPVTEQEGLAVVWAIRKFSDYLSDQEFTVTTDHSALKQLLHSAKLPNGRMLRWFLALQPFTFEVVHRAGKKHQNADALSRMPQSLDTVTVPVAHIHALQVVSGRYSDLAELINEQRQDSVLEGVWQVLLERSKAQAEKRPADYKKIQPAMAVKELERVGAFIRKHHLELDSGTGLVVRFDELAGEKAMPRKVPFWPKNWQKDLVAQFHDDDRNGHPGQQQQFRVMRQHAYWPRLHSSIEEYIAKCNACQAGKSQIKVASVVPSMPMPVPSEPFTLMGMDALALPKTRRGNNTLVVFTDYLTRWVEAAPMKCAKAGTPKSSQVADALMEHVICRHGMPETMLSDQGTGFCLDVMKLLALRMGIKQKTTAPYHPQANGLTERFNRTFIGMLRTYPQGMTVREWDERLPLLLWAYRCHYNLRSKRMPFFMLYGREPRLPGMVTANIVPVFTRNQWVNEMLNDLPVIWSHAAAKLRANADRIERETAKLIAAGKLRVYEPRDKVRVRIYAAATSKVDFKDKHIWRGPMTVTKRITPSTYEVEWFDAKHRRNTFIVWSGHMQPASDVARQRPAVQSIQEADSDYSDDEKEDDAKTPISTTTALDV